MSQVMPRSGIRREPCFWLSTSEAGNGIAERTRTRMVNGRRVTEKVPQHGHDGDYETKMKAKGQRFVYMIRHEGHEISCVMTNAAAHLDPSGPYGNYVRRKARFLGWYPSGTCPCAHRLSGALQDHHIVSTEVREAVAKGEACANQANRLNPCKHDLAERAVRTVQWNADHLERLSAFRSEAEKVAAEQRAMNADLLKEMAMQVARIMAEAKTAETQMPPVQVKPEKK